MTTASGPVATTPSIRGFVSRLTFATAWGEGLDGYDLGVISVVLPLIATSLHMSPVESGLIAASSLIGIFIGSPLGSAPRRARSCCRWGSRRSVSGHAW